MNWNLPIDVDIDGTAHEIRNKCDYRVVLDVIEVLNDEELELQAKILCALFIFYGNAELDTPEKVKLSFGDDKAVQKAVDEMTNIIGLGNNDESEHKPALMDWQHDFDKIAPPINRVLGYSVRGMHNYTHWYDFIGAYQEIGECSWATIVHIRSKKAKGKSLDKWERGFYNENKKAIDLPRKLTQTDKEWLESE